MLMDERVKSVLERENDFKDSLNLDSLLKCFDVNGKFLFFETRMTKPVCYKNVKQDGKMDLVIYEDDFPLDYYVDPSNRSNSDEYTELAVESLENGKCLNECLSMYSPNSISSKHVDDLIEWYEFDCDKIRIVLDSILCEDASKMVCKYRIDLFKKCQNTPKSSYTWREFKKEVSRIRK